MHTCRRGVQRATLRLLRHKRRVAGCVVHLAVVRDLVFCEEEQKKAAWRVTSAQCALQAAALRRGPPAAPMQLQRKQGPTLKLGQ